MSENKRVIKIKKNWGISENLQKALIAEYNYQSENSYMTIEQNISEILFKSMRFLAEHEAVYRTNVKICFDRRFYTDLEHVPEIDKITNPIIRCTGCNNTYPKSHMTFGCSATGKPHKPLCPECQRC